MQTEVYQEDKDNPLDGLEILQHNQVLGSCGVHVWLSSNPDVEP